MTLAADHGPLPMNIAGVLLLDQAADLDQATLKAILSKRINAVPRLRQRLVQTPLGCGRPVWLNDPTFDLARHLRTVELELPGTRDSLLQAAASAACSRLDPRRPLWAAHLIRGVGDGCAALVIVMHHVLADGIGGLAVLAALVDAPVGHGAPWLGAAEPAGTDQGAPAPEAAQPSDTDYGAAKPGTAKPGTAKPGTAEHGEPLGLELPPTRVALAREALGSRATGLARLPRKVRAWGTGMRELGLGGRRPLNQILAPATSLNRPTGGRRRLTTVRASRTDVVAAAHRDSCTVNDIVLTAVTGALASVLKRRGETPLDLVVSIPVSTRRATTAADLGNHTGVLRLRVPIVGEPNERLRHIAGMTRIWRNGPRGESAAPMSASFRLLAALRLFQPFVDHQRLVNTFVTNIRGPQELVHFAGHRVLEVIPVAVVPGNVGVAFGVLSYADQLVVTLVADPSLVPDQSLLTNALSTELSRLVDGEANG